MKTILFILSLLFICGCNNDILSSSQEDIQKPKDDHNIQSNGLPGDHTSSHKFEIRIFSATWCTPCHHLHEMLEKLGIQAEINLTLGNELQTIPLTFIDASNFSTEENKIWNKKTGFLPEVQLLENGSVLGADSLTPYNDEDPKLYLVRFESILSDWYNNAQMKNNPHWLDQIPSSPEFTQKLKGQSSSLLFVGTGRNAANNPIFIATSLNKAKDKILSTLNNKNTSMITLYGEGKNPNQNPDASISNEKREKSTTFIETHADDSFTSQSIAQYFKALKENSIQKALLVFSGHGNLGGIPSWNSNKLFTREEFSSLVSQSKTKPILVSGNCYGGQFAKEVRCGFFAARPDISAAGCSPDAAQLLNNYVFEDYSSKFIESLTANSNPTSENIFKYADFNKDNKISFSEAHWYSTLYGSPGDITYTTLDALADEYFEKNPEEIPASVTKEEAFELIKYADQGEATALNVLYFNIGNKVDDYSISTISDLKGIENLNRFYLKKFSIPFHSPQFNASLQIDPFAEYLLYNLTLSKEEKGKAEKAIQQVLQSKKGGKPEDYQILNVNYFPRKSSSSKSKIKIDSYTEYKVGDKKEGLSYNFPEFETDIDSDVMDFISLNIFDKKAPEFRGIFIQLIRRLVFKQKIVFSSNPNQQLVQKVKQVINCEKQTLNDYLN